MQFNSIDYNTNATDLEQLNYLGSEKFTKYLAKYLKYNYAISDRRGDAFNKASMGTDLNDGAVFETAPSLPNGLNGIVVASKSHIVKNCVIYH